MINKTWKYGNAGLLPHNFRECGTMWDEDLTISHVEGHLVHHFHVDFNYCTLVCIMSDYDRSELCSILRSYSKIIRDPLVKEWGWLAFYVAWPIIVLFCVLFCTVLIFWGHNVYAIVSYDRKASGHQNSNHSPQSGRILLLQWVFGTEHTAHLGPGTIGECAIAGKQTGHASFRVYPINSAGMLMFLHVYFFTGKCT